MRPLQRKTDYVILLSPANKWLLAVIEGDGVLGLSAFGLLSATIFPHLLLVYFPFLYHQMGVLGFFGILSTNLCIESHFSKTYKKRAEARMQASQAAHKGGPT